MSPDESRSAGCELVDLQRQVHDLEGLLRERFRAIGLALDLAMHPEISHETAQLLQTMGDAIPIPVFFKNRRGVFTFCNQALVDLLGLEHSQIVGHETHEFLPAELASELKQLNEDLLDTGTPQVEERRLPLPDGKQLDVEIHRSNLLDGDGHVIGLVGSVLDLSLQRQAVSALKRSEVRYRGLFEHALDGILIMDGNRFVECNPAAVRIYGRSAEDLIGHNPMEFSPIVQPDGRLSAEKAQEKIVGALNGLHQFFEWVHLRGDGTPIDVEVSLSPLELDDQTMVLAIVRDITDRKQVEAALRASEEFNRGMIQNAPMGVMYVDMDGIMIYENPAMERMMGVPRGASSKILGRAMKDLPGLESVPMDDLLSRVGKGEVIRNFDVDYTSVYMVRSQLRVQISPHLDGAGRVVGAIFMIQDVTELRNLEQQLRQAQKLDAIGSLAGGIAHDFNNLLTGISGNAELALQNLDKAEQASHFLHEQIAITKRAAELTRRLLAFSRQQDTAPRPVLLSLLLQELDNMLHRVIGESVSLEFNLATDLWAIRADAGQLEQIVLNLVINARDAMPDGGRLSINVRNTELSPGQARRVMSLTPGPYVLLEVSDTGCGIQDELRARIFEPFFTTKEMGKGTGLGLSIVYAVMKKCDGGIVVESEPGKGSTFKLYFPSIGPLHVVGPSGKPNSGELLRGNETVLVIEDEQAVRELTVKLLEHCGYSVMAAADGQQALDLAAAAPRPADMILSDVIMPGMSGPAAVRRLLEIWPGTKVLFCSGYTDGELSRHDLSPAGGSALLNKPYTLYSLSLRVRQTLDGVSS